MLAADVDWGPLASWFAAGGTILAATVALLGGFRVFDWFRAPRLRVSFQQSEPWCRTTQLVSGNEGYWVRVRVENVGHDSARGCVGKLTEVRTDGTLRGDRDPMQLRWGGVPDARGFDPIDLRRGQHEFLNVLETVEGEPHVRIVTFPNFAPGFSMVLEPDAEHLIEIDVAADNTSLVRLSLIVRYGGSFGTLTVRRG